MRKIPFFMLSGLLVISMILASGVTSAHAGHRLQVETESPTATNSDLPTTAAPTETDLPANTATSTSPIDDQAAKTKAPTATQTKTRRPTRIPSITPTPGDTDRALILATYSFPGKGVVPGSDFRLVLELYNQGKRDASNVIVTIQGDKLIPRGNGGVQAVPLIASGGDKTIQQILYATPDLAGQETVSITITVAYTDDTGESYSTPLVILVNLKDPQPTDDSQYTGSIAPTKTSTEAPRSKLIIGSYKADIEKLQAGNLFKLTLDIQNLGNATARDVTMVLGGATVTTSGDGTPASGGGGVSGGGADLSKFAPMGSSNLYYLGNLSPAISQKQTLALVVNVATDPGVYPLKISFVYENGQGERLVDDQVITLLVYALPQINVGFYDTVGDISIGEFRPLPIQITNTGKKATILGEVTVSASSGTLSKNIATVGNVDTGGYFTLDPEFVPDTAGKVTLTIQIKYTDDFQQAGVIEKTLSVNVVDGGLPPDGGTDGNGSGSGGNAGGGTDFTPPPVQQESFLNSFLKAVLGFFGFAGG